MHGTRDGSAVAFYALAAALSVLAGVAAVQRSEAIIAAVLAAVVGVVVLSRLDGWQRLYTFTLVVMFLATSNLLILADQVFYLRYAAAAALAFWGFAAVRDRARLSDIAPGPRHLVQGLWVVVVVAAGLAPFSINIQESVLQTVALAALVAIVHGLAVGRWADGDPDRIAADLAIPVILMAVVATASLAAEILGVANTRTFDGRFSGLFDNPNTMSISFTLGLMLAVAIFGVTRRKRFVVAAVPLLLCLAYAQSRTAILALLIAALWYVMRRGLLPAVTAFALIAIVGIGMYLAASIGLFGDFDPFAGIEQRFQGNEGGDALNGRTVAWSDAIRLFQERSAIGYGYASGPTLFARHGIGQGVVHNSYLQWLLEVGILGAIALVGVLASCLVAVFRARATLFAAGLGSVVLAGLLMQVTESAMFGTGQPYPYIFWPVVLATLALPARHSAGGPYSGPKRHSAPMAATHTTPTSKATAKS